MKTILYILQFQKSNLIKVGITTNISHRISTLEKASGFIVNHHKSVVITHSSKSHIRLLEKNLLSITKEFNVKFKEHISFAGMFEFRSNNCINLMFQFITDQKGYGIEYKKYTGIDVCGQYSHNLPKVYFPIYYPIKGIAPNLKKDALELCAKKKWRYSDFLNQAIYRYLKTNEYLRKEIQISNYEDFFKV